MMCFGASGLSEIGIIKFLDSRILVRLTNRVVFIRIIQYLSTQSTDVNGIANISRLLRLASAVDTAAWAAHNLNKVVVGFAGFYFIEKVSGIAETGGNSDLYVHARTV